MAQQEKDSLLARDADALVEELRFIYYLDQGSRKYLDYGTFDKRATDSIEEQDRAAVNASVDSLKLSKETREKIWANFLNPLDSLKTVRMLEIIDTYGFPSTKRLKQFGNQHLDFNPLIILVHTPFSFSSKVIPVIEKEYAAGNLKNRCEYGYLLWHLNGRRDFSHMLNNGYEMVINEDGSRVLESKCD